MIQYEISTGTVRRDGTLIGVGYSGQPECKNNPSKCSVHDHGPIPPGLYTIEPPRDTPTHGPYVLPLTPDSKNEMYGRSGFLIHGDSIAHPGTASHGCIILPRAVREAVHKSGDINLEVVPCHSQPF